MILAFNFYIHSNGLCLRLSFLHSKSVINTLKKIMELIRISLMLTWKIIFTHSVNSFTPLSLNNSQDTFLVRICVGFTFEKPFAILSNFHPNSVSGDK